ncbi:hypothetical protein C2E23DRAFT_888687 [Lenzites betulinus]|nr:hypothetical protein C2E23DRAFT_888687 [Lenzites betulinus]
MSSPTTSSKPPYSGEELGKAGPLGEVSEDAARTLRTPAQRTVATSSDPSSGSTATSVYAPDEYERTTYYNGIAGESDHPVLIYRSDLRTTPFPKPAGRFGHVPVKSVRGAFNTPLNAVWGVVAPRIGDAIKARGVRYTSISVARFFIEAQEEEALGQGTLGPVVIWISVYPGSTSADTAHEVSEAVLAILAENGVEGVVVEWTEGVVERL